MATDRAPLVRLHLYASTTQQRDCRKRSHSAKPLTVPSARALSSRTPLHLPQLSTQVVKVGRAPAS